jgi:hypothetical protein
MAPVKQQLLCNDCLADFEIKFDEEEHEPVYCPFCGADLLWDEDEDELDDWDDPDNDEYE